MQQTTKREIDLQAVFGGRLEAPAAGRTCNTAQELACDLLEPVGGLPYLELLPSLALGK